LNTEKQREIVIDYIKRWIGTPFTGNTTHDKMSCSGVVNEALKSVGIINRFKGNLLLPQLYERFKKNQVGAPKPGCIVFWFKEGETKPEHVDILIDHEFVVGTCVDELSSCVKMNHINYKLPERYEVCDPFQ